MQLRTTSRKKFTVLLCTLELISIVAIYPRQTMNFFYSTATQVKDYTHFYGYRPARSFTIRIPVSYTIHGTDVPRWQERIDWQRMAKMRDNGIHLQFVFIKATKGEKLVDPYFSCNWQLSRENGLLRRACHYFSPSAPVSVQARLFLQTVNFSQGDFPTVLDIEERGKLSAKELHKRVSQWLKMIEKRTGEEPVIYSGTVFYHTNLAGYFDEYPWQVAHYYRRHLNNDDMVQRFWQHSDRGQVGSVNGPVDFNMFNGTVGGLQAFVDGIKEVP